MKLNPKLNPKLNAKIKKSDWILALIFIVLGCAVYALTCSFEQTLVVDSRVTAEFFPRIIAGAMILLALLHLFRCWRHGSAPEPEGLWSLAAFTRPALVAILIVAYVLALEPLGFIIATFALCVMLMYVTGNRTLVSLLVFPAALSVSVYAVFYKLLVVPLPEGLFYF